MPKYFVSDGKEVESLTTAVSSWKEIFNDLPNKTLLTNFINIVKNSVGDDRELGRLIACRMCIEKRLATLDAIKELVAKEKI